MTQMNQDRDDQDEPYITPLNEWQLVVLALIVVVIAFISSDSVSQPQYEPAAIPEHAVAAINTDQLSDTEPAASINAVLPDVSVWEIDRFVVINHNPEFPGDQEVDISAGTWFVEGSEIDQPHRATVEIGYDDAFDLASAIFAKMYGITDADTVARKALQYAFENCEGDLEMAVEVFICIAGGPYEAADRCTQER